MSYYNQQQPPVGVPPPQGYPSEGYAKDGYPPQGYPPQGYPPPQQGYPPQGYPPQGYPPQYPPQYAAPPQKQSSGCLEGWPNSMTCLVEHLRENIPLTGYEYGSFILGGSDKTSLDINSVNITGLAALCCCCLLDACF